MLVSACLGIAVLVFVSTMLVVACCMLSSQISREEEETR